MSDSARQKSTLYVSNLSMDITSSLLESAFIPFGDVVSVSLPKPELASNHDPHRGFGYVEFEEAGDAKEAIDNMDQSELFGRVIKVAQAKPQKSSEEGLGSKTAVWEQEGWLAKHAMEDGDRGDAHDEEEEERAPMDPMQGLEGLDEAGPRPA